MRVSEKEVPIVFFSHNNRSTAVVSSLHSATLKSNALFGFRDAPGEPVQELYNLDPYQSAIEPRIPTILDDFKVELIECFIIRINFGYIIPGKRQPLATCNEEGTNFFCEHIICIEDDDGNCKTKVCVLLYCLL